MPTLEPISKMLSRAGEWDLLLVYFHGLGGNLDSILGDSTTLDVWGIGAVPGLLSFVLGDLLEDQIGEIGGPRRAGVFGVEYRIFLVGHKFVEHI